MANDAAAAEHAARALALVNDHSLWTASGPWLTTTASLLEALASLSAVQEEHSVVDAHLPFADRAARLIAWCASHPDYSSSPLSLCASLPGKPPGTRGVTAAAALPAGAPIVCVPAALALSTDSAYLSWELGPLLDQPKLLLGGMTPVILTMHLLVEHAKARATPLAPGAEAAGVPLAANAPTGRPPAIIAEHREACAKLEPGQLMTTHMRPDAHPWGSPWRAFLACLPERVPNCMFWSARHFARLAHTRVGYSAARFLRDNAKVYLTLAGTLTEAVEGLGPRFTWAAFRWAQACCMSRQNQLPSLPSAPRPAARAAATTCMALLPIFDMLNHDPREPMPFFTPEPAPGIVTASLGAPAAEGAELCMNYGPRAAGELLTHQGFLTPPSLAADAALLTLTPPPAFAPKTDAIFAIKTGLLEKLGVHWGRQGMMHLAALAQSRGEPPQVTAGKLREEAKWGLPMDFPLRRAGMAGVGLGGLPAQAWTYARVLCLERKDAAAALRAVQEVTRRVEAEAAAQAREEAEGVGAGACCSEERGGGGEGHTHGASGGGGGSGGGGHSHDGGATQCQSSHGHSHGGGALALGQARLGLPEISSSNEQAARAFLAQHLRALQALAQGALQGVAAEAAAGEAQPEQAEDFFILQYLESQAEIIEAAQMVGESKE